MNGLRKHPRYSQLLGASLIIIVLGGVLISVHYYRQSHNRVPGIYLTGPRDVSLRTPYDYQIEVLPAQSYKDVGIWISEPESNSIQHEMANLTANKPWIYDLTTEFDNTQHLNDTGISVSVVANSGVIYFQDFPMQLSAHQVTGTKQRITPSSTSSVGN